MAALAGCGTAPPATARVQYMEVNGARLPYVDEGRGAPVLLVHGALADYRTWDRQCTALAAEGFRAISYTQRYFGTEPWTPSWPPFGTQTHVDDLVNFIRGLDAGRCTWSAGHTVDPLCWPSH
ncbi:alpha/beta hydrolase [Variovorax rhizosphaerae]|uniref:Alpha/beta hydrolase n=1 Tax=Variovorax rhizosphaerae TaxID=1836200 RepID=A0ABU8WXM7_9BURK